jgi:hypothetical protein
VLLPYDYYIFSENLLGFSVPGTNNPNPLFTATSPFIDLLGVKYVLSREPLEGWKPENEVRSHMASLRWVRFFDAMVRHSIMGGATYGFFDPGDGSRFSLFFPKRFMFETTLRVTEPFLFVGLAMKDVPKGSSAAVRLKIDDRTSEFRIREGNWEDRWFDLSPFTGKVVRIIIESGGNGNGEIALGDFGLSPGYEKEHILYDTLLTLHKDELNYLEDKGVYEGIHIYENKNVMERAFVVHRVKMLPGLNNVIDELQKGEDFRKIGLVTDVTPETAGRIKDIFPENAGGVVHLPDDRIAIKKYGSGEIALEVESRGGLLVLSDLSYPGWKVKVNGRQEKVIKVFGLLRGVILGKGKSEIVFSYRPMSLYAGSIISVSTLIGWLLFLYYEGRRKRSRQGEEFQK